MSRFAPSEIFKTFREVKSLQKSIEANAPSLSLMRKDIGEERTCTFLELHLIQTLKMINVSRGMSGDQIKFLSQMINDHFWNLTISDLKLFFENILLGKYKNYQTLSIDVILGWLGEFNEERIKECMKLQTAPKESINEVWKLIPSEERESLVKNFSIDEERERKEKEYKEFKENYNKKK